MAMFGKWGKKEGGGVAVAQPLTEVRRIEEEVKRLKEIEEEKIAAELLAAEEKKTSELEMLRQMDVEARQTLQGDYLERYVLAKELGLERQAEIARIEGITNTVFIDIDEQEGILLKKQVCKLGYSVGGTHYHRPNLETRFSSVEEFPGKINRGAMLRYQELKDAFEKISILDINIGTDPLMFGTKKWNGEKLCFMIMLWE